MKLTSALIADDSRIFRMFAAEVVGELGVVVHEAATGRDALDLALTHHPDLLLLDALMPLLSGFDVVARLRELAADYSPKVFIVTAVYKSRRWELEARQQYRVDEYLEKPLEPEDLIAAIRRHFSVDPR